MIARPKVVLLGMLTKIPVGGVIWLVRQYAIGFQRLGFDVYYVEAHGRVPSMFMEHDHDDGNAKAAAFIADQMGELGMDDRWAYHAVHDGGRCYGMSRAQLNRLYRDAALVVNLHGGTVPLEEHAAGGRLVYMGTDPVELELELHRREQHAVDFLEPHVAFFTWGLNYGNPDCRLPWSERFPFVPSPPPVVVDQWQGVADGAEADAFTTVGNWRQPWRAVTFEGEVYTWSKHHEFEKILDLPRRVDQRFELALSSYTEEDRRLLEEHGWRVRPGLPLSADATSYRDYVAASRGELTAAKDQNVRLRTGWFSERSATYLAAGRPVIQQDTGFGNAIPTGNGVFAFSGLDDAAEAVEAINADYERHRRAATDVARSFFNYDVVLTDLLDHAGVEIPVRPRRPRPAPVGGAADVLTRPVPGVGPRRPTAPRLRFVVVVPDDLGAARTRLESLLDAAFEPCFEIVAVAPEPPDDVRRYLSVLAARNKNVRVLASLASLAEDEPSTPAPLR
ncbi:MAG TPA: hypothetical protein VHF24_02680 [Acidimicrobiales bacterium]|nr:hypothetical protein [Acidimicrobiales bacterium]